MTDELIACPFCGAGAQIENGPPELWYAECTDCGISGKIRYSKEAAIEVWNRRTPAAPAVQGSPRVQARGAFEKWVDPYIGHVEQSVQWVAWWAAWCEQLSEVTKLKQQIAELESLVAANDAQAIRDAALEEAANECESLGDRFIGNTEAGLAIRRTAYELASDVRALKSQVPIELSDGDLK